MSKTSELMKKVSIALTGGIAISTLASCGSSETMYEPYDDSEVYYESSQSNYESTSSIEEAYEEIESEDSTYYDNELESEYSTEEIPYDENCNDWILDGEDNVWMCNDSSSSYYHHFFFLGTYYATKNMLHSNNQFKQYKSSGIVNGTSTSTKKSGFGSGVSGGYGG